MDSFRSLRRCLLLLLAALLLLLLLLLLSVGCLNRMRRRRLGHQLHLCTTLRDISNVMHGGAALHTAAFT